MSLQCFITTLHGSFSEVYKMVGKSGRRESAVYSKVLGELTLVTDGLKVGAV